MALEGSDCALPPIDMDPTSQMREMPCPDANDILTRFVHLDNLVEMIAMHVGLVKSEDPATTPEDLSESSTPVGVKYLGDAKDNDNDENAATPSKPPRMERKLAESSGSEPDHGEDNNIYFLPQRSSPKTFPIDDSISKYVSSCFYTCLKDDDFNNVKDSYLKPDLDFFKHPV